MFCTIPLTADNSINLAAWLLVFSVLESFSNNNFAFDSQSFWYTFLYSVVFINIKCPAYISHIPDTFAVLSLLLLSVNVISSPLETFSSFASLSEITIPSSCNSIFSCDFLSASEIYWLKSSSFSRIINFILCVSLFFPATFVTSS